MLRGHVSAIRESAGARPVGLLTLSYHSEAVVSMSEAELLRLQASAQSRNRAEGVTSMVIYDHGHFFQWLEGPPEAVERIWSSVRSDPRHRAIELLARQPAPARMFADWDMKLSYRGDSPGGTDPASTTALIENLVAQVLLPTLVLRHLPAPAVADAEPEDLRALAGLLMVTDLAPALAQLELLQVRYGSLAQLSRHVLEPTARALGDLWQQDDCSELDVTLALCQMQTCMRQICRGARARPHQAMPAVLIAPQPGEPHGLVAALDGELLWQAGWDTRHEFPVDDASLQQLLAERWFDVLDLSLSPAFARDQGLQRMGRTIVEARRASNNPALVIVVGGRVFVEQELAGLRVGADAGSPNSASVESRMLRALTKRLGHPWGA